MSAKVIDLEPLKNALLMIIVAWDYGKRVMGVAQVVPTEHLQMLLEVIGYGAKVPYKQKHSISI